MNRGLPVLLAAVLLVFCLSGCNAAGTSAPPGDGKMEVVTTIYPLYDFARQVGGDRVEVTRMLPPGVEPHDWEPTARDMVRLSRAKVFIYNGAGMEPWVDRQLPTLQQKGIVVVEASRGLDLITGTPEGAAGGEEAAAPEPAGKGHNHGHPGTEAGPGGVDPHVWLDPVQARQIVQKIRDAFMAADPAHADEYQSRAQAYLAELAALDGEYREAVQGFQSRDIVTSHAAFGYLARRYGLHQVPVMGLSPQSEPDPAHMRRIADFCREHHVKYIFFETLVSPKLSETLAREVGAATLVLNPLEGLTPEEERRGENYLSIMRQNLARLKMALGGS
ncbi:MAG TPA: zinc ABC transporter substrate-binding protein [Desulfotomaculum sp.]|nr:zinc ABC transporter substrate-binding protein [Desulfotomaculum sp.]